MTTTPSLNTDDTLLVLNALPHLGPITANRLLTHFQQDISQIFRASTQELRRVDRVSTKAIQSIIDWRKHFNPDRERARLAKQSHRFVSQQEDHYPQYLKHIDDPPLGLYCIGDYDPQMHCIAIVGSRRCTLYGQRIAQEIAAELSRLGFCIVSGLARGIDTAAHRGALAAQGPTIAVLGCGIDIVYPPENLDLYQSIAKQGALLSEFPLGRRADKQTFPMRNRIISGLSHAVIVIETDEHGGSMITARMAAEQGRQVFAVPGHIDQASSRGCHRLIRNGASLLTGVDDILEELNYLSPSKQPRVFNPTAMPKPSTANNPIPIDCGLSDIENKVLGVLKETGKQCLDTLAEHCQLNLAELAATLLTLELKQRVAKHIDGTFESRS